MQWRCLWKLTNRSVVEHGWNRIFQYKKHLKNVGPIRHCEPPHALILHCHPPGVATVARRHCRTPPAHRCPRRRRRQQRQRVTEGTATAPWNGPNETTIRIFFAVLTVTFLFHIRIGLSLLFPYFRNRVFKHYFSSVSQLTPLYSDHLSWRCLRRRTRCSRSFSPRSTRSLFHTEIPCPVSPSDDHEDPPTPCTARYINMCSKQVLLYINGSDRTHRRRPRIVPPVFSPFLFVLIFVFFCLFGRPV